MLEAETTHGNEGSLSTCGLMDASVLDIYLLGSGTTGKGPNQSYRPNWHMKQRPICARHKKFHGMSASTANFPIYTGTAMDIASTRNWGKTTLTWKNLDNALSNLRLINDLGTHYF